jgi:biopolymer transport protein TolR
MTKRQVRTRMRRMREQFEESEEETTEINLVPYMDIVTNIIIFLLASVINQVPLGTVNASSPTFGGGGGGGEEEKAALNLTVTVGSSGFTVAGSGGVMPTIPKLPGGDYDFSALTTKLVEVKKEFYGTTTCDCATESKTTPECCRATFNADSATPYDTVVKTLDAMREDNDGKALFPGIVFAAGIL